MLDRIGAMTSYPSQNEVLAMQSRVNTEQNLSLPRVHMHPYYREDGERSLVRVFIGCGSDAGNGRMTETQTMREFLKYIRAPMLCGNLTDGGGLMEILCWRDLCRHAWPRTGVGRLIIDARCKDYKSILLAGQPMGGETSPVVAYVKLEHLPVCLLLEVFSTRVLGRWRFDVAAQAISQIVQHY